MIKKKSSKMEEVEKPENSGITDNKDNNSQDRNSTEEEDSNAVDEGRAGDPDTESVSKDEQPATGTVKETGNEVTADAKLAEMQDRYLRLSAEFDNYRKRTLREKIELTRHAGENILINIIPVMDDFERALKVMDTASDSAAMKSGIELIYNKFRDFLVQNGIKEIEAVNNDFNVDLHDAISKVPASDESLKGKVVEVVQKGYYLHDKVLRHSKVVVGE